ncbi:dTMP kinase [Helicobacter muridarum]|uniref:Thymidylate kinase n=1 Tax=Helicobacter muridarum TaxID=216 RepID=A0A099U0S7_9HELI|nr:dTMP kinase [Helicobacter muridarum]TLE01691.1 dTMP kinase [Helicobacter muridarum]STQ86331.1 thymidylate kinase [Helicobacter muridarum]
MRYFVIEGVDTSGKSTHWNLLATRIQNARINPLSQVNTSYISPNDVIFIQEPSNLPLGKRVRDMILHENITNDDMSRFLLFLAQRAELIQYYKSLPNIVISDRSLISGIAYKGIDSIISIKQALDINLIATRNILPEKIVFLKLSYDEIIKRLKKKMELNNTAKDHIELKGAKYLYDIQLQFEQILQEISLYARSKDININILELDASYSKEILHNEIRLFFGVS